MPRDKSREHFVCRTKVAQVPRFIASHGPVKMLTTDSDGAAFRVKLPRAGQTSKVWV
ncbi:MAG: hypothetical protein JNL67_05515 [Planctomycetaceae bacterium]|nr:hypothetical protein [Planctomycetaceae bacterium]